MPELPEVQTIVNDLVKSGLVNLTIEDISVLWEGIVSGMSPEEFTRIARGKKIKQIRRRGKYIIWDLSGGSYVIIHLRMTGKILVEEKFRSPLKHEHLTIKFSDGKCLFYHDVRKFGRFYPVEDTFSILGKLGPEPLDSAFTVEWFRGKLYSTSRLIKPLLLDQRFLAGLGNIYVDEALWEARIHPLEKSHALTSEQVSNLHHAIRYVLKKGLKNMGTSLGSTDLNFLSVSGRRGENQNQLNVFRRQGLPCFRCGATVEKIVVGQRGTHLCPECQKKNFDKSTEK